MAAFPRSEAEVTSILEEFEARTGVFGLTVEGVSLWRLLRFEIALTMQNLGLRRPRVRVLRVPWRVRSGTRLGRVGTPKRSASQP